MWNFTNVNTMLLLGHSWTKHLSPWPKDQIKARKQNSMAKLIMWLYADSSPILIYYHSHNTLEEGSTKSLHNLKITTPYSFRWRSPCQRLFLSMRWDLSLTWNYQSTAKGWLSSFFGLSDILFLPLMWHLLYSISWDSYFCHCRHHH